MVVTVVFRTLLIWLRELLVRWISGLNCATVGREDAEKSVALHGLRDYVTNNDVILT